MPQDGAPVEGRRDAGVRGAEIVFASDMTKLIALVGELRDRSGAYFLHPYAMRR